MKIEVPKAKEDEAKNKKEKESKDKLYSEKKESLEKANKKVMVDYGVMNDKFRVTHQAEFLKDEKEKEYKIIE